MAAHLDHKLAAFTLAVGLLLGACQPSPEPTNDNGTESDDQATEEAAEDGAAGTGEEGDPAGAGEGGQNTDPETDNTDNTDNTADDGEAFLSEQAEYGEPALSDVSFGSSPSQSLDVYFPPGGPVAGAPTVVYYHGGAWAFGSKERISPLAKSLADIENLELTPTLVSVGYRLSSDDESASKSLQDAASGIRWIQEEGPGLWGADPDQVIAMGFSSGGTLAAEMALNGAGYDLPAPLAGYISESGVLSVTDFHDLGHNYPVELWLDCPEEGCSRERLARYSAENNVLATAPPAYIVFGEEDRIVSRFGAEALAASYEAIGIGCRFWGDEIFDTGHSAAGRGADMARIGAFLNGIDNMAC